MKRTVLGLLVLSSVFALSACVIEQSTGDGEEAEDEALEQPDIQPSGRGIGILPTYQQQVHNEAGKPGGGNGISYHGGPVMLGAVNVYYIWYGNWSGNTAVSILTDLAQNLGGTPYWNINTSYKDGAGNVLSNTLNYAGSTTDSYSKGTALTDNDIQSVVSSAITTGKLPSDTNGIYLVLTSADVNATSGFCTQYCGWHTYANIGGKSIKYSFVGNPDRCPASCEMQTVGPNGNAGADGMASIIAHELEEAATDPQLNAWYDVKGYENADKCAWTFGTTYTSNGATANMQVGSRHFLIQRNWVNASGGFCATGY